VIETFLKIKHSEVLTEWELVLIRKIDFLNFAGTLNVLITLILFSFLGFTELNVHFFAVFGLAALVYVFNRLGRYLLSSYLFFAIGIYILSAATVFMKMESYALMYFFPLTLSIVQLLGRKETFKHLIVWLIIYFLCINSLILVTKHHTPFEPGAELLGFLQVFNILLSFFCGLILIIIITWTNISQESQIRKSAVDKATLLAELFHRVKNNLNIVTSLLNILKNNSGSKAVQDALEECRNRVFSMALVHQQMYSSETVGKLNLKTYLTDLILSIEHSFGGNAAVTIKIEDDIYLPISKAVPTGLILNELITNVYKHAVLPEKKLEIDISIWLNNSYLMIELEDNGPGIEPERKRENTLGIDLIKSLSEQIDATFHLSNKSGSQGTKASISVFTKAEEK
jgi:two-component sensor histidine kinase